MYRLLSCKVKEDAAKILLDDEADEDQCPTSENLQEMLRDFCSLLINKVGMNRPNDQQGKENNNQTKKKLALSESSTGGGEDEDSDSWVDALARILVSVPPLPTKQNLDEERQGTRNFRMLIVNTLKRWANESKVESTELIRVMFRLLLRQYAGVKEVMEAMSRTYVLHDRNVEDVNIFIQYLLEIRELLNVQLETCEEAVLKHGLWQLMNNRIFFQHPDLMRLLCVHKDVMTIMMNVLRRTQQNATATLDSAEVAEQSVVSASNASEMVVACSRFLCYFCRTSRMNQKAMFEHLSFLLDNATMLLSRPSLRGFIHHHFVPKQFSSKFSHKNR
jgi:ryanodine receptor 2